MLVPNIHRSHASKKIRLRMITINAKSDGIKYNRVIHIPYHTSFYLQCSQLYQKNISITKIQTERIQIVYFAHDT